MLIDAVRAAAAQYREENNLAAEALIPADAVTSSGSGLDPHISPRDAILQAGRVATARSLTQDKVREMVSQFTGGPQFRTSAIPA